jgi:membrane associated rhomboid family serine protease
MSYHGGFFTQGLGNMGFENRDYYREDDGYGNSSSVGSDLSITMRMIIICATLFLINLFLFPDHKLTKQILSLHDDTYAKPWLWFQYLTYGFAHNPQNIGHILWNMLALFFFGADMERLYGRREYLRFYLATILLGGLAWSLRTTLHAQGNFAALMPASEGLVFGSEGVVTALTLLFCIHYPNRNIMLMGVLPVPAWIIGALIILGNLSVLMGAFFSGAGVAADPSVVGVVFTILYYRFGWSLSSIPGLDVFSNIPRYFRSLFRSRPQLKVYSEGEEDAAYSELETQADRILSKLHRDGEASLSPEERKLLERYSRLMRQKLR